MHEVKFIVRLKAYITLPTHRKHAKTASCQDALNGPLKAFPGSGSVLNVLKARVQMTIGRSHMTLQ